MEQEFKPNDVVIILRPAFEESESWDGRYTLMVAALGPITLSTEDIQHLLAAGLMMASTASLMETDKEVANKVLAHCEEVIGLPEEEAVLPAPMPVMTGKINKDTPTVGGMQ